MAKKTAKKPSAARRQQIEYGKAMDALRRSPGDHDLIERVLRHLPDAPAKKSTSREVDL